MEQQPTSSGEEMVAICPVSSLTPDRGAAALLPDGTQVAVFLLEDGEVHAVQQYDPYSGTNILSRGLVGSHLLPTGDGVSSQVVPTLSSPMYKQSWSMTTGEVLDSGGGEDHPIAVYPAEVRDGDLHVGTSPLPRPEAAA